MPDHEEDFIFKTDATIPYGSYCSLTMPTNPAGSKPSQYQPHDARLLRPTSYMLLTPCAMPRARRLPYGDDVSTIYNSQASSGGQMIIQKK